MVLLDKSKNDLLEKRKFQMNLMKDTNLSRLFIIMVVVFIFMAILNPKTFLTMENFSSMAVQLPEFGILAIAMMISMLSGGIELSIVGTANLAGVISALMFTKLLPADAGLGSVILMMIASVFVSAVVGLLCGAFNGFTISKIGIPPILATLGAMQVFTGLAIIITKGKSIVGFPDAVSTIGNGTIGPIPIPMIIFVVVAIIFSVILNRTSYGLKLYMMGTNPKASKFTGINNVSVLIRTYMLSGLLAAMAGLIIISRSNSAKADYGNSYTLQAVLVAVMGGVNPDGGFGRMAGIVFAMLTLQFLSSGFNMLNLSSFLKDFMWGLVLIVVMVVNYISNNYKSRKLSKSKQ